MVKGFVSWAQGKGAVTKMKTDYRRLPNACQKNTAHAVIIMQLGANRF